MGGFIPSLATGPSHTCHGEGIYFTPEKAFALGFARRAAGSVHDLCLISFEFDESVGAIASLPSSSTFKFDAPVDFTRWVWVKITPPGDRIFLSMFPFTCVPFWVPIFDSQPGHTKAKSTSSNIKG